MRNACAELVQNLRIATGTTCARLSTFGNTSRISPTLAGAQPVVIRAFTHRHAQLISTANLSFLPLFEHYLYPVSTPPIIRTTK